MAELYRRICGGAYTRNASTNMQVRYLTKESLCNGIEQTKFSKRHKIRMTGARQVTVEAKFVNFPIGPLFAFVGFTILFAHISNK